MCINSYKLLNVSNELLSRRCNTCGEYIYKGKKFNARKETVENEDYYGIKIFRFYIKWSVEFVSCPSYNVNVPLSILCSAEITFKTDPKNTDYAAEHGASRNFEPWRDEEAGEEEDRLAKLEEEENNPMKALENRTTDSKREMDILDALQDIRARNARNERLGNSADLLAKLDMEEIENEEDLERKRLEEEDERLVREVFSKIPSTSATTDESSPETMTLKRKADVVEPSVHSLLSDTSRSLIDLKTSARSSATKKVKKNVLGIKVAKKQKV